MIKIIQYGLLCGVLMLTACSDSSPPADDATDDATAASDADVARSADGYAVGDRLSPEPAADEAADGQRARTLIWDE